MQRDAVVEVNRSTEDVLGRAFTQHYEPLLRVAIHLTRSAEEAEDLVQETFVRSAPHLATVDESASGAYLRTTLVNLWRSRFRRLRVERRALPLLRASAKFTVGEPSVEDIGLWLAIRKLPDRQRLCVVLRYAADLPEREVANAVGCSPGAVKRHLHRAFDKLRKELKDE